MRSGFVLSILFHAAIVVAAALTIVHLAPLPLPENDVPVDVQVGPQTNVKAEAPKAEKPVEQPPAPTPAPPPPAPTPAPPAEAQPAPAPPSEAQLVPSQKPEPKKPDPKPQQKPAPPSDAAKPKDEHFDPAAIQALLNKEKKNQPKEQKTADAASPGNGDPRPKVGAGTDNTADIETMLVNSMKRQVEKCWNFPAGAAGADKLLLWVDFQLKPDGTVVGTPTVEDQGRMGEPYFRAAAEAAVRAVERCQPYDLPADHYALWKEWKLSFDPSELGSGQ